VFPEECLHEAVGLQHSSELSTTNGSCVSSGQRVCDEIEWSKEPAFSRTEMYPTRDVSDLAYVFEVGMASDTDTVKGSNGHLKQYTLT